MKIGIGKIGKTVKFVGKFTSTGGDIDCPNLIKLLAKANPDNEYYIIGRSDLSKVSESRYKELYPNKNVFNCISPGTFLNATNYKNLSGQVLTDCANLSLDYVNEHNIKFDAFIVFGGPMGKFAMPNLVNKIKIPEVFAKPPFSTLMYATPIINVMNSQPDVKVIELLCDPRYHVDARDWLNTPEVTLAQFNESYTYKAFDSFEDQTQTVRTIQCTYAPLQNLVVYERQVLPIDISVRTVNFSVILHQGKPSRLPFLKEWVTNHIDDVEIYGKWDNADNDPRFKGELTPDEVFSLNSHNRSTFIIPIKEGWVTAKFIESIHAGVVPFMHPSYDTQNHLNAPEFLRVKTPDELLLKIEMMKNDATYLETINSLRTQYLTADVFNGTELNTIINGYIRD